MKAKIASKIIKEHLDGKYTEASKKMFSEIAEKLIAAGVEPPFKVTGIKVAGHLDDFLVGPQSDEHSRRDHKMIPETNEFEDDDELSSVDVSIPSDLALKIMEYHGGQWSAAYAVGSSGYAGEPVPLDEVEGAEMELTKFLRKMNPGDENKDELIGIIQELKHIIEKNKKEDGSDFTPVKKRDFDDNLPM